MINNPNQIITWLLSQDKDKMFEIKEYKPKRSLNSNDYYWVLVNEIANVLKISKEELHLRFLKDYSQSASVLLPSDIDIKGYARYYEQVKTINVKGSLFTEYRLFKGSSELDSKEMSILLDCVVQEAKDLNINVLDERKIEEMKASWGR